MAFQRTELKLEAKRRLAPYRRLAMGIVVVNVIVQGLVGATFVGTLLISGPLMLGWTMVFLAIARGEDVSLGLLFRGFARFTRIFLTWLRLIVVVLLWTLLLIVPGVIAGLRYAMTWFVLVDEPELTGAEAMRRSRELMKGHEGDLFVLFLSFFWWFLFCIVTIGIGLLYVAPYLSTSVSLFYDGLRAEERERVIDRA